MKPPCYKCPDRTAGCHAECGRYKEYAEQNAEAREKRYRENSVVQYNIEKFNRALRKKRKKRI